MIIQLQDLLLKGQLGNVHLFSKPKELLKELGETLILDHTPESVLDLIYGYYHFTFLDWESSLCKISCDVPFYELQGYRFKNDFFEINPWFLKGEKPLSIQKTQYLLHQFNISYTIGVHPDSRLPILQLSSGAMLCFSSYSEKVLKKYDVHVGEWYLTGFVFYTNKSFFVTENNLNPNEKKH